jgi:MFS family permease
MKILSSFHPKSTLTNQEVAHGLRMMTWEGMTSNGFTSITTSGFLAAYALALGADNFQIGIMAALPFLMQLVQIPAVFLVEKIKKRKIIAVVAWFIAQLIWFPVALIPLFFGIPSAAAISFLLLLIGVRGIMSAVTNCSWNSWTRDLVPQSILGRFYSKRLALSTAMAAGFSLVAAFFVDFYRSRVTDSSEILGYTWILLFGALFLGLASPVFMSRMPEPLMKFPEGARVSFWKNLLLPLRQNNFRRLMLFLLYWGFALNLAVPFFTVYMLQRLQMPLLSVIALAVLSQIANISSLRIWGSLTDRFGSKVILSLCASLYVLVILGWTFTTMPEKYTLTIPLLIMLHIFTGIAAAGVTLTVGTLSMKLAPEGQATSFLTGASLSTNLGAGLGPLAGGFLAKYFSDHELKLDFAWSGAGQSVNLGVLHFTGFDFLFAIAFVIGLIALNGLTGVRETGEVKREVVLSELLAQSRGASGGVNPSPLMGLSNLFPMVYLKKVPGFDVAIGVTTYQIAETTRGIMKKAIQGRDFSSRIIYSLEKHISKTWKDNKEIPAYSKDFTEQATEGAIQAAADSPKETVSLIRPAVIGIANAMSETESNPEDIIRGLSEGVSKVMAESGDDLTLSATEILDSIKEAAKKLGLDDKKATEIAVQTILTIVHDIDPKAESKIHQSLFSDEQSY